MLKIKNDLYFCCCCCFVLFLGIKGGAVVRALASHQCDLSSNPGLDAICWLSLLLVIFLALRGFSLGTPVFLSPWKPTLLNSNSTWSARTRLKDFLKPPKYFVGKQTNKYKLNYKCNFVCFVLCLFACLLFLWLFCTISFFSFQTFVLRKIRDNAADNVSDAFPGIYVHERKQCNVKKTYSRSILTLCYTMISFYLRSSFSFFCSW